MNKKDLVRDLADHLDCTQREANSFMNGFIQVVSHKLVHNEPITLINFGSFVPCQKKVRTVTIPLTNNKVVIPAHTAVRFKASKKLFNSTVMK